MAMTLEYFELTEKYTQQYGEKSILFMQCGSFFEVYCLVDPISKKIWGSRIEDFSQICELAIVDKVNVKCRQCSVKMSGFKVDFLEKYLKKMQEANYTIAVHVQDENIQNTTRSLLGIFSPGTYFNEESTHLNNHITCLWIEKRENRILNKGKYIHIGISNMNILTGKSNVCEYKEPFSANHNPSMYDGLEHFLSIYQPSEIIFISNLEEKEMKQIMDFANIQCPLVHKLNFLTDPKCINCQKQIYQPEILNKFFFKKEIKTSLNQYYDYVYATQSLCFLLEFVHQHNPFLTKQIEEPTWENTSHYMKLANHSLKQLNILEDVNQPYSGPYSSVMKLLNVCLTPMGKRSFYNTCVNPRMDVEWMEREYEITDFILKESWTIHYPILKKTLQVLPDLSKSMRQIFIRKMTPHGFYKLYIHLKELKNMIQHFFIENNLHLHFIQTYLTEKNISVESVFQSLDLWIKEIERNLSISILTDIENGLLSSDENFICQGIDMELDKSMRWKESLSKLESISEYFNSLLSKVEKKGYSCFKIHETQKNNFSILGTKRRCLLLKSVLPKDSSTQIALLFSKEDTEKKRILFEFSTKNIVFIDQSSEKNSIESSEINMLCQEINSSKTKQKELISNVYKSFMEHMEQYQVNMEQITQFVTCLDILYAKATIAKKYNYCRPFLQKGCEEAFVSVKDLRHPLIEHIQQKELYVANSLALGKKQEENNINNGFLLFGVNAVGKTSLIKALGISVILAQAGLFVPATEFVFYPFDSLFTRILGNDNLFKGWSTFEVEMNELSPILTTSTLNSLVLGDELCSGTENISAISLFIAGMEQLEKTNCKFIFATHLHEIVKMDEIKVLIEKGTIGLKHMKVRFDAEKDLLIYDRILHEGSGESVYGLEVCKSLNLPNTFLQRARDIREKYYGDGILSLKTSHYNSQKLIHLCEKCGIREGKEVHHLQHQKFANKDGFIQSTNTIFHKNHSANLITLCEKCHDEFHHPPNTDKKLKLKGPLKTQIQHKQVKTNEGYIVSIKE